MGQDIASLMKRLYFMSGAEPSLLVGAYSGEKKCYPKGILQGCFYYNLGLFYWQP